MSDDDLRPTNARTGERKDTPLIDDLADVLSHLVAGWKPGLVWMTGDLAEHPEVVRVMARYRQYKDANNAILAQLLESGGPIASLIELEERRTDG